MKSQYLTVLNLHYILARSGRVEDMSISKCPADAITSFPLYLTADFRPTQTEYDRLKQDIQIDGQFAPRIIPPTMNNINANGILDEGTYMSSLSGDSFLTAQVNALNTQGTELTTSVNSVKTNLNQAGSVLREIDRLQGSMKADRIGTENFGSEHYRERQFNYQKKINDLKKSYETIPDNGDGPPAGPNLNASTSTLVLNNNNYTLYSVQIVKATHTQWLIGTPRNTEDIIVTFKNINNTGKIAYVIFIVPIFRDTSTQNPYLYALSNATLIPGTTSISIKDVLPKTQYIYYITCLDGYSDMARTQEACTFLAVNGLNVSETIMNGILSKYSLGTTFPNFVLPYTARLAPRIKTMIGKEDLSTYIVSTTNLFGTGGASSDRLVGGQMAPVINRINTDAVKCTVLNPDTDIGEDNIIRTDIDTGTILSNVIEERTQVIERAATRGGGTIQSRKNVEKIMQGVFGFIFAFLLLATITYKVCESQGWYNIFPQNLPPPGTPSWYSLVPWWAWIGVICLCLLFLVIGTSV